MSTLSRYTGDWQPGEDARESAYRRDLAFFGRMLHERHYVSGTDGNLSVRLDRERVLTTPTGVSKGLMKPEDMVVVNLNGHRVSGNAQPSSEIQLHLTIYATRSDVGGVVHAHPCTATGFASSGLGLTDPICSELVLTLGKVPLAPYAHPGSEELSQSVQPFIESHSAILLENHGVVTYGETLRQAYFNMEAVEHCARIALTTNLLGHPKVLDERDVSRLLLERSKKRCQSERGQANTWG